MRPRCLRNGHVIHICDGDPLGGRRNQQFGRSLSRVQRSIARGAP